MTEISRFATNLLQFGGEEEEDEDAVGITEEVVEFVLKISKRPELWTDFPLTLRNDVDMSDVQREHAATIEDLVPSLVALKHEICNYLNEEQFWMIYFIFLLPRLNENDSKLLSTPEIVEAREILLQKLQNKNNAPEKTSEASEKLQKKNNAPVETSEASETVKTFQEGGKDNISEANKSSSHGNEVPTEVVNAAKCSEMGYHVNTKWFKERGVDRCASGEAQKQSEDDLSFSDLEDDDNDLLGKRPGFRREEIKQVPSCSESNEWVQLNENLGGQHKAVQSTSGEKDSESGESYDWLTIDDLDLDRP